MIKEEGFCWRCFDKKVPVGWVGEADCGYYQIYICKECAKKIIKDLKREIGDKDCSCEHKVVKPDGNIYGPPCDKNRSDGDDNDE